MRLMVACGTRPEFVKLAPVVHALCAAGHEAVVVATGQHYDSALTDVFFEELALEVHERWELDGGESARVGQVLERAFDAVGRLRPDATVVLGDTYTVPLFALASRRHRVPVIHLEAGLRSFNATSMEEVNRRVAAATAQLHLAPTETSAANLLAEGVDERSIFVVGNPVLDAMRWLSVEPAAPQERDGVTVTIHRAANVDDPVRLKSLLDLVPTLAARHGKVTFPIHPRTRKQAVAHGLDALLDSPGVQLVDPLPYSEMLQLVARSRLVVTDSGGLQEEAAWLGVPAVVLRPTTPRPEGVAAGMAAVVGPDPQRALAAAEAFLAPDAQARVAATPCPYGDGRTAARVVELLDRPSVLGLLRLDEPSVGGRDADD